MIKYAYLFLLVLSGLVGGYVGAKFFSRSTVREVAGPATVKTQVVTQTKVIERFPDGKVVERTVSQTSDKVKTSPQPARTEYRAGILFPIGSDRIPTVTAGKRLFTHVWSDVQFDIRHKEALVGISYEW